MAINPSTNVTMSGRVTPADANYPYASAKDETAPGAGDGSPYFKARADDLFGLQQSLLRMASIVPSGNADTALVSQYLQSILEAAAGRATAYDETGIADVYVLDLKANQQGPASYFDGMIVEFIIGTTNTAASTIDVAALGVKNITGTAAAGTLTAGDVLRLRYNSTSGEFGIVNNTGASVSDATTTQKGIVELATNAETITGTDAVRALTAAGLQAKVATTTQKGIVELATNTETITGTDTTRAVVPAGLKAALDTVKISFARLEDQKPSGTDGQADVIGWQTRDLNTEVYDPDGIVTLSANQFTLQVGTYIIRALSASTKSAFRAAIYNVTDTLYEAIGNTTHVSTTSGYAHPHAPVETRLVVSGSAKAYTLRMYSNNTLADFGRPVTSGDPEVYSSVNIEKVS